MPLDSLFSFLLHNGTEGNLKSCSTFSFVPSCGPKPLRDDSYLTLFSLSGLKYMCINAFIGLMYVISLVFE